MNLLLMFSILCAVVCFVMLFTFFYNENEAEADSIEAFFKGVGVGSLFILAIIGFTIL